MPQPSLTKLLKRSPLDVLSDFESIALHDVQEYGLDILRFMLSIEVIRFIILF
jgi:hypothetical protein